MKYAIERDCDCRGFILTTTYPDGEVLYFFITEEYAVELERNLHEANKHVAELNEFNLRKAMKP